MIWNYEWKNNSLKWRDYIKEELNKDKNYRFTFENLKKENIYEGDLFEDHINCFNILHDRKKVVRIFLVKSELDVYLEFLWT